MRENPPNFNSHGFLQQKVHRGRSSITTASQGFSMHDLLAEYGIEHVDFMNMGIESAEFLLFDDPRWLYNIDILSMTIHEDPFEITKILSFTSFVTLLTPLKMLALFTCIRRTKSKSIERTPQNSQLWSRGS